MNPTTIHTLYNSRLMSELERHNSAIDTIEEERKLLLAHNYMYPTGTRIRTKSFEHAQGLWHLAGKEHVTMARDFEFATITHIYDNQVTIQYDSKYGSFFSWGLGDGLSLFEYFDVYQEAKE